MSYREIYESWLENPYFDEETKRNYGHLRMMKKKSKTVFIVSWSLERPDYEVSSGQVQTV